MSASPCIVVVGLGYVGLPLAVALAGRNQRVIGFDVNEARVAELRAGHDRTGEVAADALRGAAMTLTADPAAIAGADIYIVTVPTPVDADRAPDLSAVRAACATVGAALRPGAIVVLESTVYPGVTEDICGPALEAASGLRAGVDFHLGYSPERINPGDTAHGLAHITKVVAGQTPQVADRLAALYGTLNGGNVFVAASIRVAEAAKVIENAQRDINIAFINEITLIFRRLGLSVYDVLAAARTKWNFLDFRPGLVGGHCIGIDPFYLAHCARAIGHEPEVILSGRRINDAMPGQVAAAIDAELGAPSRLLVLGLTFKENVPDLRNSGVAHMVAALRRHGHEVTVHDPLADPHEARDEYGIALAPTLSELADFDGAILAVAHRAYHALGTDDLAQLVRPGGLIADIKGLWFGAAMPSERRRWSL